MTSSKVSRDQAITLIGGLIVKESVVYYDDAMQRYYVGPVSDLDDLCDLMASTDADVARDAYSHWCAGTTHSVHKSRLSAEAAARR